MSAAACKGLTLAGILMLGGCMSSNVADTIDRPGTNVTMAGTPQVIGSDEVYRVGLRSLLVSYSGCTLKEGLSVETMKLEDAFSFFRNCNPPVTPKDMRAMEKRNAVQDHIKMVADRRCEIYKQSLSEVDSVTTFGFGSLSTITGVLGGLFEEAAQGLSAASGISSGINAQFSKSFFKDTAMPVMFAGIDMKRLSIASHIATFQKLSASDYTIEHAISDVMQYNGACSAFEGMKAVQEKIGK